jgi:hypothetical protein
VAADLCRRRRADGLDPAALHRQPPPALPGLPLALVERVRVHGADAGHDWN